MLVAQSEHHTPGIRFDKEGKMAQGIHDYCSCVWLLLQSASVFVRKSDYLTAGSFPSDWFNGQYDGKPDIIANGKAQARNHL